MADIKREKSRFNLQKKPSTICDSDFFVLRVVVVVAVRHKVIWGDAATVVFLSPT